MQPNNVQHTLAFTGHRPESLPFGANEGDDRCVRLKKLLYAEIVAKAQQGYTHFLSGMARGADIIFAEQVLRVQESDARVRLLCVIPFEAQASKWSEFWRDRYFTILEQADDSIMISSRYTTDCLLQRNRYMVDRASSLLAVFNGTNRGGTAYTVRYAQQRNKEIVLLNPSSGLRTVLPPKLQLI